ncbi:glycosyltransferase family 2 protein [bacterium]|nr:glycosyltransferase family 2 protein [FCB group bacterium]MBL7191110.1 glycosyltransferase family 2 protein [bacterium]
MKISVVAPLYDEEGSLKELHRELSEVLQGREYEIIFVNDGSRDHSLEILREIAADDSHAGIISFRRNRGKSAAMASGFREAKGDILITIDADLQDDPHEIPNLIKKIEEGFDLVSGWKRKRRDPISKTIPSRLFNWVTAKLTGIPLHDFNCGLKAYKREVVENLDVYGEMHRYLPVLAKYAGFKIGEVSVHHRPRLHGRTKFGVSRFLHGFLDLLTVLFITRYTLRPLHLFGSFGIVTLFLGIAICAYLSVIWFMGTPIGSRPLFFLGILLILLGVQFFSIGLLGEMITRSSIKETPASEYLPPKQKL